MITETKVAAKIVGTALAVFLLALAQAAAGGPPAVFGHVFDPGGYPLEGATLTFRDLSGREKTIVVRTGRDGAFSIPEILDGEYSVEVSRPSFMKVSIEPVHIEFPVAYHRDFRLDFCCVHEGGISSMARFVGRLTYLERSLPKATICLRKPSQPAACTETNGLGQYFLSIEPGSYEASVEFKGRLAWKQNVELPNPGQYRDVLRISVPLYPINPGK